MRKMEFHPLANLVPMMNVDEFASLVADIEAHGLKQPVITTLDGKILDGRNRYLACMKLGITPRFEELQNGDASAYVKSLNLIRRMIEPGRRVALLIDTGLLPKDPALTQGGGEKLTERVQEVLTTVQAAKIAGVSERVVSEVRTIAREYPDLYEEIQQGASVRSVTAKRLEGEFKSKGKKHRQAKAKKKAAERPRVVAQFLDALKQMGKEVKAAISSANEGRFDIDNPGLVVKKITELVRELEQLAALLESGGEGR